MYDYEELEYLCRQYVNARTTADRDCYIGLIKKEIEKAAPLDKGWLSEDRPMPGSKKAVRFFADKRGEGGRCASVPLDLLGIPLVADPSTSKGKIVIRDRDPGDETDLHGNDQFGL